MNFTCHWIIGGGRSAPIGARRGPVRVTLQQIQGTITALLRTRMITAPSESCWAECRSAVFRLIVARALVKNRKPVLQKAGEPCAPSVQA
jgi:hypothetical protein